ncbi:MAG: sigma-54-dependent Fis family transcriptional regulator [Sedimentisphaerales bacterium]|nr:sigma-54-dependent Fis family transcriptional regulator [Sedimentisphaerales bacterium]
MILKIVLLDIQMPGADGIKVLREIMKTRPETRVIMITAFGSVEMAVEAIKLGACDYVIKPVMFDDILTKIHQQLQFRKLELENRQLKDELQEIYGVGSIIGQSRVMQSIFEIIQKVAQTKSNVLIIGESGTGKELVVQAIHSTGTTSNGRFIGVNSSAIPEQLLESELFGHKKGSFTSAIADKKGLFEIASLGTLFLDEIGSMPLNCQVKLLRSIEDRRILSIGAVDPIDIDLRIIAAINRDPIEEVKAGRLREDLFYRLNVVGIHLPPLREGKEDIPLLINHFIKKYNTEMGKSRQGYTEETLQVLMDYPLHGRVVHNFTDRFKGPIGITRGIRHHGHVNSQRKYRRIDARGFCRECQTCQPENDCQGYGYHTPNVYQDAGTGTTIFYSDSKCNRSRRSRYGGEADY